MMIEHYINLLENAQKDYGSSSVKDIVAKIVIDSLDNSALVREAFDHINRKFNDCYGPES